jgi:uncharacterized membrane protein
VVLDSLSPAAVAWLHRGAVFGHIAAVVVWFGAVAYYLLILRPALRRSGVDRHAQYAILGEIRARLKRVVGVAVVVLVVTGFVLARLRGFFGPEVPLDPMRVRLFHIKLAVAAILVVVFLTALPLLRRVRTPKLRGRLFVATHAVVLALGAVAAAIGVLLGR